MRHICQEVRLRLVGVLCSPFGFGELAVSLPPFRIIDHRTYQRIGGAIARFLMELYGLAPFKHIADGRVFVHNAVLDHVRAIVGYRLVDLVADHGAIVGVDDVRKASIFVADEGARFVARELENLVADKFHGPELIELALVHGARNRVDEIAKLVLSFGDGYLGLAAFMSRVAATTTVSSSVSTGLRVISTGNRRPSFFCA